MKWWFFIYFTVGFVSATARALHKENEIHCKSLFPEMERHSEQGMRMCKVYNKKIASIGHNSRQYGHRHVSGCCTGTHAAKTLSSPRRDKTSKHPGSPRIIGRIPKAELIKLIWGRPANHNHFVILAMSFSDALTGFFLSATVFMSKLLHKTNARSTV